MRLPILGMWKSARPTARYQKDCFINCAKNPIAVGSLLHMLITPLIPIFRKVM
jgi:hypothetical protein